MERPKYLTRLEQIPQLSERERADLQPVAKKFVFRSNDYYDRLIDWSDPDDPIRRLVIPEASELEEWGRLDASFEELYTKVPGLEHKYRETALLLVNDVCGAYCRYCFRKRLFIDDNDEVVKDVSQGLDYIRRHPEISNVLLTGGDPLIMSTSRLEPIVSQIREIEHVRIIRIGSKMPAFNPFRIINDPSLFEMIGRYSTPRGRIYIMAHFNHPRELTAEARRALNMLRQAGAAVVNQSPIIRGINDRVEILAELFRELSFMGVPPYYMFQCRPTEGNKEYSVPLERAYEIFRAAQSRVSGLARSARFCMSHVTGKIEVTGLTAEHVVFKYHQAADSSRLGKVMIFERRPSAHWFDDYPEAANYRPKFAPAVGLRVVGQTAARC